MMVGESQFDHPWKDKPVAQKTEYEKCCHHLSCISWLGSATMHLETNLKQGENLICEKWEGNSNLDKHNKHTRQAVEWLKKWLKLGLQKLLKVMDVWSYIRFLGKLWKILVYNLGPALLWECACWSLWDLSSSSSKEVDWLRWGLVGIDEGLEGAIEIDYGRAWVSGL